jgi:putative hydrolase
MTQRIHGFFPSEHFETLMAATLERGIAIEISSSYLRDPIGFMDLCRRIDPVISIGSDVHRVESIGECRDLVRSYLSHL